MLYRGNGMVSGNNSSRLLLDYKYENPEAYQEILEYLFGEKGLGITHLKLEMGSDINSSSGTEPAVMRSEEEEADVTRGAGYQLAADAKAVNPDLTLDMLWWSEPKWVSSADDVYAARYKWYKQTLDAAYETYGIRFDYVSAVQNERAYDADWIKYLSAHLKAESDAPYDYSKIKIVGGDEVCTWNIADEMLYDEQLRDAIDVAGSHYTSWSSESARELAEKYGKELWFSEASSPMEYTQGTYRLDETGSGMSDINGMLDIANRFITMYAGGGMTLCEYQPAVAAYYDGVTYCQKQLILANEPWSGYYMLDSGFFMGLHFSQFMKKGWTFIEVANFADGKIGGDGHAIVDANYSYMTAADPETGDYSTVITNTTDHAITYEFTALDLDKAGSAVHVWETRGPDEGSYDENFFKHIDTVTPEKSGEGYKYSVTVKPYSLVTLSTLDIGERSYNNDGTSQLLSLPYTDDYEYDDDYISSRGGAPRYTTDEGGAFEVVSEGGNKFLMQKITPDIKAPEWGSTPDPVTNFGDDRWFDYSVGVKVKFAPSDKPEDNYTGVGLRYILADRGQSGYWIQLYQNGDWYLKKNGVNLDSGKADSLVEGWNDLKIEAQGSNVKAYINGEQVSDYTAEAGESVMPAGRAALYSSYNNNCFDEVDIQPMEESYSVVKYDNTDACVTYEGEWEHSCMSSFKNYKRTISTAAQGSTVTLKFTGTGFGALGENKKSGELSITIDGKEMEQSFSFSKSGNREITYSVNGLEEGEHTAVIKVLSEKYSIDSFEIYGARAEEAHDTDSSSQTSKKKAEKKSGTTKAIAIGAVGAAAAIGAAGFVIHKKRKK
ncbi:MAG: DUF1080 domain-containing protein [Ruminococcus sp.]|nr:DUF1080 domain-containing protein [Ruminococcus sp.]